MDNLLKSVYDIVKETHKPEILSEQAFCFSTDSYPYVKVSLYTHLDRKLWNIYCVSVNQTHSNESFFLSAKFLSALLQILNV
mgnify:CR=1 FL=1